MSYVCVVPPFSLLANPNNSVASSFVFRFRLCCLRFCSNDFSNQNIMKDFFQEICFFFLFALLLRKKIAFLKNGFCSYFVFPWFGLIYLISERHCCCWFFERIFGLKKWAIVFIKFSYKHILIISFINDYFSIYFTHLIYNDREILKDRGRMGHWQQQQEGMQAKDIISIIWEICNFGWTIWVGNFICNQKQMNIWERERKMGKETPCGDWGFSCIE